MTTTKKSNKTNNTSANVSTLSKKGLVQALLVNASVQYQQGRGQLPVIVGASGTGKTNNLIPELAKKLAKRTGKKVNTVIIDCSVVTLMDFVGTPMNPGINREKFSLIDSEDTINLFVWDEFFRIMSPDVANTIGSSLFERRLNGTPLPKNTVMVATGNLESGQAVNELDVSKLTRASVFFWKGDVDALIDYYDEEGLIFSKDLEAILRIKLNKTMAGQHTDAVVESKLALEKMLTGNRSIVRKAKQGFSASPRQLEGWLRIFNETYGAYFMGEMSLATVNAIDMAYLNLSAEEDAEMVNKVRELLNPKSGISQAELMGLTIDEAENYKASPIVKSLIMGFYAELAVAPRIQKVLNGDTKDKEMIKLLKTTIKDLKKSHPLFAKQLIWKAKKLFKFETSKIAEVKRNLGIARRNGRGKNKEAVASSLTLFEQISLRVLVANDAFLGDETNM